MSLGRRFLLAFCRSRILEQYIFTVGKRLTAYCLQLLLLQVQNSSSSAFLSMHLA